MDRDESVTRIEARSSLSLTLDRLAGFSLVLSAVTLTVALLPTVPGYRPVMAIAIAIVHPSIVGGCVLKSEVLFERSNRIRRGTPNESRKQRVQDEENQ